MSAATTQRHSDVTSVVTDLLPPCVIAARQPLRRLHYCVSEYQIKSKECYIIVCLKTIYLKTEHFLQAHP